MKYIFINYPLSIHKSLNLCSSMKPPIRITTLHGAVHSEASNLVASGQVVALKQPPNQYFSSHVLPCTYDQILESRLLNWAGPIGDGLSCSIEKCT